MTATLEEAAERVDRAVDRVRALDETAREPALELKSAIEEFHRDGLTRMVRHLRADPRGKELLLELAGEPAVYALFAMHGIVRTEAQRSEPAEAPAPPRISSGFVPLASLTMAPGWKPGPMATELVEGRPFRFDFDEKESVLLLMLNGQVNAFRNECPHQGLPLDGGMVDRDARTITCPWHGYRFDGLTGECLTSPQAHLERVEMKIEQGTIQVKLR